jgi:PAS domain S-box-containing protein
MKSSHSVFMVMSAIRSGRLRKNAEKHLAQMERTYRGLPEAASDAMVVVNQSGDIVLFNLQAERQFGYTRDELLGQKVTSIIPRGFAERLIAGDPRSADEALAQQIGAGVEPIGRRKDGSEFPIGIMLSSLQSADGVVVIAAIRNINARKNTDKHPAAADDPRFHLAAIVDSSDDAILTKALDGTILSWNRSAERLYGYTAEEIVGKPISVLVPPDRPREVEAILERIKQCTAIDQFESVRVHKNGTLIPLSLMISPIKDADGKIIAASTIARDIRDRLKAETLLRDKMAELNRSNEELERFAYLASHDLQEPLRMVASYTQLLSRRYKGKLDADADDFIAFAVDGANRMQQLIQDLLAYSRVGTKGQDLLDTSSERALRRGLINLRVAIEDSGAQVTHDSLPTVLADEMQLIQLFQNLVGNAIKYQGPGIPRIHISAARTDGQKWRFSVQDNGLGIDPQHFERIFGMFQRLHKREEFAGTGIGLAICKKIVERHGGSISVESQPGQGSTFRFVLAGSEIESPVLSEEKACP